MDLVDELGPLTAAEYGLIADAVEEIYTQRLEAEGLSREEAETVVCCISDYFAFEAAARR